MARRRGIGKYLSPRIGHASTNAPMSDWKYVGARLRFIVGPALLCAVALLGAPGALADAPTQINGTYAVTGFQVQSVTLTGTNVNVMVDESGILGGDIQGAWFWQPDSIELGHFLGNLGTSHGTFVCSTCTIGRKAGSFTAVEASGTGQSTFGSRSPLPTEAWLDCREA